MNIIYEDITLRAIEESDLEMLREMINDPEIEAMVGGYSFPISESQQKKWYNSLIDSDNTLRAVIDTKEHGAIGLVALTHIDWKNRTAQSHSKIIANKQVRNKGYGTKVRKALIKYAFEQLNLNLIYSNIIEYNTPSIRISEKCGYKRDGILRNRIFKNNKYHAIEVWSIQNGELIE